MVVFWMISIVVLSIFMLISSSPRKQFYSFILIQVVILGLYFDRSASATALFKVCFLSISLMSLYSFHKKKSAHSLSDYSRCCQKPRINASVAILLSSIGLSGVAWIVYVLLSQPMGSPGDHPLNQSHLLNPWHIFKVFLVDHSLILGMVSMLLLLALSHSHDIFNTVDEKPSS